MRLEWISGGRVQALLKAHVLLKGVIQDRDGGSTEGWEVKSLC